MKTWSPLPRSTTLVSPVTSDTPASSQAARIEATIRFRSASANPSSRMKAAERNSGSAPPTARSFTVPQTASRPMSPPGKKSGRTTNESVVNATRGAFTPSSPPSRTVAWSSSRASTSLPKPGRTGAGSARRSASRRCRARARCGRTANGATEQTAECTETGPWSRNADDARVRCRTRMVDLRLRAAAAATTPARCQDASSRRPNMHASAPEPRTNGRIIVCHRAGHSPKSACVDGVREPQAHRHRSSALRCIHSLVRPTIGASF